MKIISMKFSEKELIDLLWAWAAISFAFAIILGGGLSGLGPGFPLRLIVSSLTVGVAFIFHELAHKFVAQKYGYWSEFRRFDLGLIFAVLMSFSGFIFAAPGAVMISGTINKERNGKISIAGSVTNLVLAILFLFFGIILTSLGLTSPFLQLIISYGIAINAWLALFNMIPFFPLDGSKVIAWSLPAWLTVVGIALFILFI